MLFCWRQVLVSAALLLVLPLGWAQAQTPAVDPSGNHILATAYWEDPQGQASFETATAQVFTPYSGVLSRGYTDSVHWIRVTVAGSSQPLGLRLLPPWLDEITLYDPVSGREPITLGDRFPRQLNAFIGIGHFFALPAHPQPRDMWLRVESSSSHLLSVQAVSVERIAELNMSRTIWSALYTAFMLFLLIMLLPIWWVQRDKLLGIFLVKHVVYIHYGSSYLGLPTLMFSDWLPPAFFDISFTYATVLVTPLALRFDIAFLSLYGPQRHLLKLTKLLAWIGAGNVVMMLAGYVGEALKLNVLLILVAVFTVMAVALTTKPDLSAEQVIPKKVMVAYYALILSNLPLGIITLLGWVEAQEWSLYTLVMHGLVAVLMMAAMLFVRAQRLATHSERLNWQLQQSQEEIVLEQQRRQEQSQFLHMLMHELKTPLSVVAMALGTRQDLQRNLDLASNAVQDMKAILDRCVQADRVGELSLDRRCEPVDVAALVRRLSEALPGLKGRLELTAAPEVLVESDQQLLKIIVSNLLDNAARYSDSFTPVKITLEQRSKQGQAGVALHVCNSPGLAGWSDADRIFSKYYRSVGAQRDSGSGLGLFLAQQLACSLGGSLRYLPSLQYVEFVLWIPQSPT